MVWRCVVLSLLLLNPTAPLPSKLLCCYFSDLQVSVICLQMSVWILLISLLVLHSFHSFTRVFTLLSSRLYTVTTHALTLCFIPVEKESINPSKMKIAHRSRNHQMHSWYILRAKAKNQSSTKIKAVPAYIYAFVNVSCPCLCMHTAVFCRT